MATQIANAEIAIRFIAFLPFFNWAPPRNSRNLLPPGNEGNRLPRIEADLRGLRARLPRESEIVKYPQSISEKPGPSLSSEFRGARQKTVKKKRLKPV
jgi:hypothetical protein